MACITFRVQPSGAGQRIDELVRRHVPALTPQEIRGVFAHRDVKVDGKRVPPDMRPAAGQTVAVYCMPPVREALDVVYRDADVLLINKRPGISVEDDGSGFPSLESLAADLVRRDHPDAPPPVPCHRLDNQTSGLILFALNPRAAEILRKAFAERTLDKRYICLVKGQPKPPASVCRAWLKKDAALGRVQILDREVPGSRPIVTGYETLEAGPVSRLRIHLITGRTHQIRAHMAALGHPLLGDDVYGDRAFNRAQKAQGKLMLCAVSLTIDTGGALSNLDGRRFSISPPF